ncbi:hypothetical protein ANN_13991 [Periplaneta americana]|uniref:Uncharacterized protein n=1 Tax=Periplaneta americana TaxID=6978 RepID=A0ABQ8SWJ5_PERAM|nr:hypothetical protein ANN_13991 [Periplaneta americana]
MAAEKNVHRDLTMLALHGHTVLRLPPYMCELSAIQLIWAQMKRIVRENNVTGDLLLQALNNIAKYAIASITKDDWKHCCDHVKKLEDSYWETDGRLPDVIDSIIISGDGFSTDSDNNSDSDDSDNCDTSDNQTSSFLRMSDLSDLATPLSP